MTDDEAQAMRRENDYLKLRNGQLQADLSDLSAELHRLKQALERTGLNRTPDLPGDGRP